MLSRATRLLQQLGSLDERALLLGAYARIRDVALVRLEEMVRARVLNGSLALADALTPRTSTADVHDQKSWTLLLSTFAPTLAHVEANVRMACEVAGKAVVLNTTKKQGGELLRNWEQVAYSNHIAMKSHSKHIAIA